MTVTKSFCQQETYSVLSRIACQVRVALDELLQATSTNPVALWVDGFRIAEQWKGNAIQQNENK